MRVLVDTVLPIGVFPKLYIWSHLQTVYRLYRLEERAAATRRKIGAL